MFNIDIWFETNVIKIFVKPYIFEILAFSNMCFLALSLACFVKLCEKTKEEAKISRKLQIAYFVKTSSFH